MSVEVGTTSVDEVVVGPAIIANGEIVDRDKDSVRRRSIDVLGETIVAGAVDTESYDGDSHVPIHMKQGIHVY